ncbi:MAG: carbamoyltransferase [Thermodesulfobacteriota bacterium]|nr:carbamoyltransferase [Thermodesulfobacteriota bacterium]
MSGRILGISAYYHDSAAVLLDDGEIVAAVHEERFTRKKHDAGFPANAITYVLKEGGITAAELDAICFYDKPYLKFERLLETYHAFVPRGLTGFLESMPVWIREKLFMKKMLWDEIKAVAGGTLPKQHPPLLFPEHHLSHAASAFFASPFDKAAILTIDGVGEWATTTIGQGNGKQLTIHKELCFPHSLGLLYSAFTYYCGFRVNGGEYKLMGLAPYGDPKGEACNRYQRLIKEALLDIREDGSVLLNLAFFDYATGMRMCNNKKWEKLFGIPRRKPETGLSRPYMDLALAIQQVTEEIVMRLAVTAKSLTGMDNLVMAGGVALNCVANGKLLREKTFGNIWVQPAAGDAGGALGAAYAAHYIWGDAERLVDASGKDSMAGSYLGPAFHDTDVRRMARGLNAVYEYFSDFFQLCEKTAGLLADGKIVGWFQGRMEWGPRALGNRSILGDPRKPDMQKKLNLKIKYREGFRPFAPSVLAEDADEYFDLETPSPYMLLVAPVLEGRRRPLPANYAQMPLYDRLYHLRSDIPAVTHVDFSARIQTVHRETNERYWQLITAFKKLTGYGLLVNTSFNVRGEPIVCTPKDAYTCFMRTEMDYLVIGNYLFDKTRQPVFSGRADWRNDYQLD